MKPFTLVIVAALLLCLCCEAQAQDAAPFPAAPTAAPCYQPQPDEPSGLTWGQVAGLISCLIGGGVLGGGGVWMSRKTTIDPQPLGVAIQKEFATKTELADLARKLDSETNKLSGRIDNMNTALSEIKGELKGISNNQSKILDLLLQK